ncbi:hypothetical protein H5407_04300 [Mitsuaria sp. WAJ17]|uniref:hypothetical protein n=1 Tax=Mitsuaria sp. WAJ17 TaxID=2761452 RepID=UPI001600094F|nr:hypothetical protein [Mitsuaria sp. WAJ17]MBB2484443.1 hypothetical protein [Mitsuaria sp. WAJ17]
MKQHQVDLQRAGASPASQAGERGQGDPGWVQTSRQQLQRRVVQGLQSGPRQQAQVRQLATASPAGARPVLQARWSFNRDLAELKGEVLYFDADRMLTYDPETRTLASLTGGGGRVLSEEAHATLMDEIRSDVRAEDDAELRHLGFSEEDIRALEEQGAANALDLEGSGGDESEDDSSDEKDGGAYFREVSGKVRDKISDSTARDMHSGKQKGLNRWLRAVSGRKNPDLGILGSSVYVRLNQIDNDDAARKLAEAVQAVLIKDKSGHYYGYVTDI